MLTVLLDNSGVLAKCLLTKYPLIEHVIRTKNYIISYLSRTR